MKHPVATLVVGGLATATVGWILVACSDNSATEAARYASTARPVTPTVTVTQPAPPPVTMTATVASVPQSCLDALDNADLGFTYAGQIMRAAGQLDAETMNAVTAQLNELAPTYNTSKAACRAASSR